MLRSRTSFWVTVAVLLAVATVLDLVGLRVVWDGLIWLVTAVLIVLVAAITFGSVRGRRQPPPGTDDRTSG
jgi:thiamine transporter ThiT